MRSASLILCCLVIACSGSSEVPDAGTDIREPEDVELDLHSQQDWGFAETADGADLVVPLAPSVELITPSRVPAAVPFPVVVRVMSNSGPAVHFSASTMLQVSSGESLPVTVRRGMGSASLTATADATLTAEIEGGLDERPFAVLAQTDRELSGELAGEDLIWGPDETIFIVDEVTVPAGQTLAIEPGTVVTVGKKEDLVIYGVLTVAGTMESPVLFAPKDAGEAWGGVRILGGEATMANAFFTGGGGDASHAFGHSGSQAVLFVEDGTLSLERVYIVDNPGKGLGAQSADLSVADSLISRCDTGGELKQTLALIERTWFLEMPNADGEVVDDDNDGIYLHNPPPDLPDDEPSATIRDCVFAVGKDDGIDHNGSRVRVEDSFIEGFAHEGIACSKNNWVAISNTLVRHCQQGIEAGYGSPTVTVDHCTVVDNEVGFRLGDSYERAVSGTVTVTNSIAVNNSQANVWNFSRRDGGPLPDHVDVSFSLVDSPDWDDINNNLPGLPTFDDTFHLAPDSLGTNGAEDGLDMGLL